MTVNAAYRCTHGTVRTLVTIPCLFSYDTLHCNILCFLHDLKIIP